MNAPDDHAALHEVLDLSAALRHTQYEEYAVDELSSAYTTDGPLREWHLGRAQVFASLAQAAAVADLRSALSKTDASPSPSGGAASTT